MTEKHIHIGVETPEKGFERFINIWKNAEKNTHDGKEIHLSFEDFSGLLSVLTPRRLEILKILHQQAFSVRALANHLARDYKNVHADTRALEENGLLKRTSNNKLCAPWDVIDAHFNLAA